jgi:hypothetical protein
LATSLLALLAIQGLGDVAAAPGGTRPDGSQFQDAVPQTEGISSSAGRAAATRLPDERDEPMRLLAMAGPLVAIGVLTIMGLTITFRGLSDDRRRRRIPYRQRGDRTRRHAALIHPLRRA